MGRESRKAMFDSNGAGKSTCFTLSISLYDILVQSQFFIFVVFVVTLFPTAFIQETHII